MHANTMNDCVTYAKVELRPSTKLLEVTESKSRTWLSVFLEKNKLYSPNSKRPLGAFTLIFTTLLLVSFFLNMYITFFQTDSRIGNVFPTLLGFVSFAFYIYTSERDWRRINRIKENRVHALSRNDCASASAEVFQCKGRYMLLPRTTNAAQEQAAPVRTNGVDNVAKTILRAATVLTVIGRVKSTPEDIQGEPQWFVEFWNDNFDKAEGREEQIQYSVDCWFEAVDLVQRYGAIARLATYLRCVLKGIKRRVNSIEEENIPCDFCESDKKEKEILKC